MPTISFSIKAVRTLVLHAQSSPRFMKIYNPSGPRDVPGLLLIFDENVYLMSNGKPRLMADGTIAESDEVEGRSFLAYGRGYSPDDAGAREAKVAAFGVHDGAYFLPIEDIQNVLDNRPKARVLKIRATPKYIQLLG